MKRLHLTQFARVAAVLATSTSILTIGGVLTTVKSATADPTIVTALVGVGSDTIQDVFNAYGGVSNFVAYPPVISSAASGGKGIASWDATPPGSCIAPGAKLGFGQFDRPNGSSAGITALVAAQRGLNWSIGAASTCPTAMGANVTGQIDFSRSSRPPNTPNCAPTGAGNTANNDCLEFIPFARDAVTYAYSNNAHNAPPLYADLTKAQLAQAYTGMNPLIVGGETILACITQSGSGTTKFFESAIGVTDAVARATSVANGCPEPLEENGGNSFNTFASGLPAGKEAIADFSVGSWISQFNGAAPDRSNAARTAGVDLGVIDGTAPDKPYVTNAGPPVTLSPNDAYYANATYGRDLFVVIPMGSCGGACSAAGGSGLGNAGIKSLFVSTATTTAAVCAAGPQATAKRFGFDSLPLGTVTDKCGDVTNTFGGQAATSLNSP